MHAAKSRRRRSSKLSVAFLVLMMTAAMPVVSRADEEAIPDHDARLDGYPNSIVLNSGGTASSYIMLFLFGIIGIGCVFMSGKRTHLD